ncbi:MAG: hypothetical protein HY225_02990 [Candidatus Vogelbacteria bacterium]|nr:hypothetical protein [Candidatus Vogelbacteria bacterium]
MTKSRNKTPEKNLDNVINPGTGNKNRGRRESVFEETNDTKEIPHYGTERQDNVGTGPDDTGGHDGPDGI